MYRETLFLLEIKLQSDLKIEPGIFYRLAQGWWTHTHTRHASYIQVSTSWHTKMILILVCDLNITTKLFRQKNSKKQCLLCPTILLPKTNSHWSNEDSMWCFHQSYVVFWKVNLLTKTTKVWWLKTKKKGTQVNNKLLYKPEVKNQCFLSALAVLFVIQDTNMDSTFKQHGWHKESTYLSHSNISLKLVCF